MFLFERRKLLGVDVGAEASDRLVCLLDDVDWNDAIHPEEDSLADDDVTDPLTGWIDHQTIDVADVFTVGGLDTGALMQLEHRYLLGAG